MQVKCLSLTPVQEIGTEMQQQWSQGSPACIKLLVDEIEEGKEDTNF